MQLLDIFRELGKVFLQMQQLKCLFFLYAYGIIGSYRQTAFIHFVTDTGLFSLV